MFFRWFWLAPAHPARRGRNHRVPFCKLYAEAFLDS
jgi:hypothetical protein